ncbi:L-threonylcarbamoyladenylate synthase [Bartonella sp. DGB1]|uniref:L-threonylcarbamoyladenylate synthase n=1 Tax=Bartonella sp. DGB1 TaxID=3239807 RepID=UPI0035260945
MTIETLTTKSITKAVELLTAGDIVALPTETVYGLAADSYNTTAIDKIYTIKGRPKFNPLIAHVADLEMAMQHAVFCNKAKILAEYFWAGPLTLVLPLKKNSSISSRASAGLSTIALRKPHGVIAEIAQILNRPLVAPSANSSGFLSATTAQAVYNDLGDKLPLILDGGTCDIGLESTIIKIDATGNIYLLRAGGLAIEQIEQKIQQKLITLNIAQAIEAPGMLKSHYAPNKIIRMNANEIYNGELLLAFGKDRAINSENAAYYLNLSPEGNLIEAAYNLFDYLHKLDNLLNNAIIAVEPIPNYGLGVAINDRLIRASANKD